MVYWNAARRGFIWIKHPNTLNFSISKYIYINNVILHVVICTAVIYLPSEIKSNGNLTDQYIIQCKTLYFNFKGQYLLVSFLLLYSNHDICHKTVIFYINVKLCIFNNSKTWHITIVTPFYGYLLYHNYYNLQETFSLSFI